MNTFQRILMPAAAAALLTGGGALAAPANAATPTPTPTSTPTIVYLNASDVHLREHPNTHSIILATLSHTSLADWCQTDKNTTPIPDPSGGTNRWWSKITLVTGSDVAWVSNVFLWEGQQGSQKIADIPDC
ncbi:MAG: peptidase M23 [Streptomycetaceae bacterium]|nr:peptidase M23 [Streptomycetaceae bacterium]